jgi:hypothetical protein
MNVRSLGKQELSRSAASQFDSNMEGSLSISVASMDVGSTFDK